MKHLGNVWIFQIIYIYIYVYVQCSRDDVNSVYVAVFSRYMCVMISINRYCTGLYFQSL